MKEATFLKQNEKKWKEFEKLLQTPKGAVPPDEVAELFLEVTDDLSYARTHFPESKSVHYLNGLAGQVHLAILRNKRAKGNQFLSFWKVDLPMTLAKNRFKLYWAFAIFAVAVLIGAVSTVNDMNFARLILSDDYVDMTVKNIQRGEPLAVYNGGGEVESFMGITVNNIRVSFLAFVAGVFLSIGAGYGKEAMLTVMIHGTLELSAIVIAGMAGFTLGHSILFPKTHSRMASLRLGALDGLKIVLGLVPVFIVAGFLEGFVTRHTDMPAILSILIIASSMAFIVYYFVIYPLAVQNRAIQTEKEKHGEAATEAA